MKAFSIRSWVRKGIQEGVMKEEDLDFAYYGFTPLDTEQRELVPRKNIFDSLASAKFAVRIDAERRLKSLDKQRKKIEAFLKTIE
jgi:hypothetical protein